MPVVTRVSKPAAALFARLAMLVLVSMSALGVMPTSVARASERVELRIGDSVERTPVDVGHDDDRAVVAEESDPDSEGQLEGLTESHVRFAYGVVEPQEAPATVTRCVAGAHTERLKSEHVDGAFSARGPPASRA